MSSRLQGLLIATVLWPALSFAQSIFIDSPSQAETVIGPTLTLRMFELTKPSRATEAHDLQEMGPWTEK